MRPYILVLKRFLVLLSVLSISFLFNTPKTYAISNIENSENSTAYSNSDWVAKDFEIHHGTIYGLSKQGLTKLSNNNGKLKLPEKDSQGKKITGIGSFAFTPNKHKAIEEYTGRPGINGIIDDKDVDGEKIHAVGEDYGTSALKEVDIPLGYQKIGQDAFAFNKSLAKVTIPDSVIYISDYAFGHTTITAIKLPENLERLGDHAFFDSQISGELIIPEKTINLGEGTFKSNKIENIKFTGNNLNQLKERVFEDNQITKINIPDSLEIIDPTAFNGNPGDLEYGGFVVLLTKSNNNPHNLPDGVNYYVDPSADKKTTPLDVDVNTWNEKDFTYENQTITGFSSVGEYKVKQNKNLTIPATHNGVEITKIGENAFRNVDLSGKNLKKYDLETVTLPNSITEIGNFAFQSNKLTEFMPEVDAPLKKIGNGAFMNNNIEMLLLPSSLEYIGDAAFHINEINFALIPKSVTYLGRSAFRQNTLELGMGFEEGAQLVEIGEMAFAESNLVKADLSNAKLLKIIGVQAFAGNALNEVVIPENLEKIAAEAFSSNQLTEIPVPRTISEVIFNAFDDNPGSSRTGNKVAIVLPNDVLKTDLADGNNFVIVGEALKPADTNKITERLTTLKAVARNELRTNTATIITDLINEGETLIRNSKIPQSAANRYVFEADFFLARINLDKDLRIAEDTLAKVNANNADPNNPPKLLEEKLGYVTKHFNNAAWNTERLQRAEHEIELLTDLVLKRKEMAHAIMKQGVHELDSPLPIPSYYIGVNVYFKSDGTVLYVLDRSYTIGADQKDEYGNPIANVDEDNEGYHELALATLADYEGKTAKEIFASKNVNSLGGIREVEKAKYHREGFYKAIQDAAKDFLVSIPENDSPIPTPPATPIPAPPKTPTPIDKTKLNDNPVSIAKTPKLKILDAAGNEVDKAHLNDAIILQASGFEPGKPVHFILQPIGSSLGSVIANDKGVAILKIRLNAGIEAGWHNIEANQTNKIANMRIKILSPQEQIQPALANTGMDFSAIFCIAILFYFCSFAVLAKRKYQKIN